MKINKHPVYIGLNFLIFSGFSYIFILTVIEKDPFYTFLAVALIVFGIIAGLWLKKKWVILPAIILILAITPIALLLLGGSFVWPPLLGFLIVVGYACIVALEIAIIIHAFGF